MLSDLEKLMAIEAIKNLRYQFSRVLDAREWNKLGELMTENTKFCFANESGQSLLGIEKPISLTGRNAALAFMQQFVGDGKSIHIASMPEIVFLSADKAHGRWCMQGYTGAGAALGLAVGVGFETIDEEYVLVDGKWFISSIDARINALV